MASKLGIGKSEVFRCLFTGIFFLILAISVGNFSLWAQLSYVKPAAEAGNAEAERNLGIHYENGEGVPKDINEAMKWYRKAAAQGDSEAEFRIGFLYYGGSGVTEDKTEAVKWFRKAAEQDHELAQMMLGEMYAKGAGVPRDDVESSKWNRKAAEKGNACAQTYLGLAYEDGLGIPKDHQEAVKWFHKAAVQNYVVAQVNLGRCYEYGQGVGRDEVEAVKWFRKAAEQGDPQGQGFLGSAYVNGKGVPQDDGEAAIWYRKAAENGDASAQFQLGFLNSEGRGVPQDIEETIKWYRKAAEQGYAEAEAYLGKMYEEGRGVPKNFGEALKWYRRAADQGNGKGEIYLGNAYASGNGVTKDGGEAFGWYRKAAENPQGGIARSTAQNLVGEACERSGDYVQALKWYRKSADQGYPWAQHNLGRMYANGVGTLQDYVEAYAWFNLAAASSVPQATQSRDMIVKYMTREQIAEGQLRASKFVVKTDLESSDDSEKHSQDSRAGKGSGSGFFITEDGYLITNEHVVRESAQIMLITSAGQFNARVIKVDAANDLALLKAEGRFAPLPIASSRMVKLGGTVATVGFPNIGMQGFAPKFARGEIASLSGAADNARYFQICVPLQPGNSGGALVDEHGNVVGIVSAKLDASKALAESGELPENVNYAVKSSFLLSFLESVPEVSAKLKDPITTERKFDDVVQSAQSSAVLVLVY